MMVSPIYNTKGTRVTCQGRLQSCLELKLVPSVLASRIAVTSVNLIYAFNSMHLLLNRDE